MPEQMTEAPDTFGGLLPEVPTDVPEHEMLALAEETPPQSDMFELGDIGPPGISGRPAAERAGKAHFGLGEMSPGLEVLQNGIENRTEKALRDTAATRQAIRDRELQMQMVKEKAASGAPVTPQDIATMAGISQHEIKHDPKTIFEKLYASEFVKSVIGLGEYGKNVVSKVMNQNPEYVAHSADLAADLIMRQEIAKAALHDTEAAAKEQSWTGWGLDRAKELVPGFTWFKTYDLVKGAPTENILKGGNIYDQVKYLYSLPPAEMHTKLREALDYLQKDNPGLAKEFAEAVVHYSASDAAWDNAFSVIDVASVLPYGTAAKGAKSVLGARKAVQAGTEAAAKGVAEEAPKAVQEAYKAAVRANAPMEANAGDILTELGDTTRAAKLHIESDGLVTKDLPLEGGLGKRTLPTYMNPEIVTTDAATNLSSIFTSRMREEIQRKAGAALNQVGELSRVNRLPPAALEKAFSEAKSSIQTRFNIIDDAILDVRHIRPEETPQNVASVKILWGQTSGEVFPDMQTAVKTGQIDYGFPLGTFTVEQRGTGWVLGMEKHIDETLPAVRSAIQTAENTVDDSLSTYLNFMGKVRSADDRLPKFQRENRKAVAYGTTAMVEAMKELTKDIVIPSKQRKALRRVMEENKYMIDPSTGERGMFYQSQGEFEKAYLQHNKRPPTEAESRAYWTFVEINNVDHYMRNLHLYRDRARMGMEEIQLFDREVKATGEVRDFNSNIFYGRVVPDLPWNIKDTAGVVIHTKGQEPQHFFISPQFTDETMRTRVAELIKDGYKIVQTETHRHGPFGDRLGSNPVNFVITKDFESRRLQYNQLPYRAGFHTEYNFPVYVAQPQISKVETGSVVRHFYDGDMVFAGAKSETEGRILTEKLETARKILKGEIPGDLDDYISKNLPKDGNWFRSLFTEGADGKQPRFSLDHSFMMKPNGKNLADHHGETLSGKYENFIDNVRSPYNLIDSVGKRFVGGRDEPLWRVVTEGTEANPVYRLDMAKEVDPFISVTRGLNDVLRNRYFQDYKVSAVEQWMSQFGKLLTNNAVSIEDIRSNPVYWLHNGTINQTMGDTREINKAIAARDAIIEFIGTESPLRLDLQHFREKIVDMTFKLAGQEASDVMHKGLIGDSKSWGGGATKVMRSLAFHEKVGFLNPVPAFQNAMTSAHAIAVSPQHGLQGAFSGMLMQGLRLSQSPEVMNRLANIAGSIGYKPEWFKESWKELQKSGFMQVGAERSIKDNLADPNWFQGTAGKALDKGVILFNETDRMTRMTAWNTAFKEWRTVNPNKVLTSFDRNAILERADLLSVNMSHASNAAWQNGAMSVPTQFMGFNARITEQMLGKRLTGMEKARVAGMYSVLYGVPIGLGGSFAGAVWNYYEDARKGALDKGINLSDAAIDAYHSGLMGFIAKSITGETSNISERVGPGGNSTLRQIFSGKEVIETFLGAGGGATFDTLKSAYPLYHTLLSPFVDGEEKYRMTADDAVSLLRNISTIDNGMKHWMAFKTGEFITKNGMKIAGDRDTFGDKAAYSKTEAVLGFFTGAQPRKSSDAQMMLKMMGDRTEKLAEMEKMIAQDYKRAVVAINNKQPEEAEVYLKRVSFLYKISGFRENEKAALVSRIYSSLIPLIQSAPHEFSFVKAPPEQSKARQDLFLNNGNK
jgi:hypothetical protein